MKNPLRVTTAFLGIYAGLIAIQHGIFEILQGNHAPGGLMFNAIGLPCQPEAVWHACFPAMTLIPSLLVTGIAAVVIGTTLLLWALFFVQHRYAGWILGLLSILLLLVGGGFVPVFIGMVAAITSRGLDRSSAKHRLAFLSALWPWLLVLMALWLPGSWLLGHFFGPAMLSLGGLLFLVFDVALPVLAAVSSATHLESKRKRTEKIPASGYFRSGLAYDRAGQGVCPLVIVQGLVFENKPQAGMMAGYLFLGQAYTLYSVMRKPGLPQGYTIRDMANDYAAMIREEFGGPVDVLGVSTGGSIAQQLAADHPALVRRLVIHSSAHRLGEAGKQLQLEMGRLAQQGKNAQALAVIFNFMLPSNRVLQALAKPMIGLMAHLLLLGSPKKLTDLIVTIEAEDQFDFQGRLGEIQTPTLLIAGKDDPFYSETLFRETAAGIPNARLVLYEKLGHPAVGKPFEREVLAFLREM